MTINRRFTLPARFAGNENESKTTPKTPYIRPMERGILAEMETGLSMQSDVPVPVGFYALLLESVNRKGQ